MRNATHWLRAESDDHFQISAFPFPISVSVFRFSFLFQLSVSSVSTCPDTLHDDTLTHRVYVKCHAPAGCAFIFYVWSCTLTLVYHVPEFLSIYGSLAPFSQLLLENLNDDLAKSFFSGTDHHDLHALQQMLLKLNRIEKLACLRRYTRNVLVEFTQWRTSAMWRFYWALQSILIVFSVDMYM